MAIDHHWLLPDGVDELAPPQAAELEYLRRTLLDLYSGWGYELILPPMLEYAHSLLVKGCDELDLRTFKVTDQQSGRTLGIRADITPQAARIDAHKLNRESPTRLCYCGTVLHTRADNPSASRAPLQLGAELYGHDGIESDLEILCLMVRTLKVCGIPEFYLDIGHVGIFRSLAQQAGLDECVEYALFEALQRKAVPEINAILGELDLSKQNATMFAALAELSGDDAIERAEKIFASAGDEVLSALQELKQVALMLKQRVPDLSPHFDLAELRGYHYHTGIVFAGFVPEIGQEVVRGGRYNEFGKAFGRARPAVGFSGDLRTLFRIGEAGRSKCAEKPAIFSPWPTERELGEVIEELRRQGRRVIHALPGQSGDAKVMGCDEELIKIAGSWTVRQCSD